jgi:SAM-dependent MidA family methyltransferase
VNAIVAEVRRRGRVSFARFMELALYHPEAGYYTRPRSGAGPTGRCGDFLTAPTASPVFARTIGSLVQQLAAELGEPVTFVELGGGEGWFLSVFLDQLRERRAAAVRRVIVTEAAPWARARTVERCRDVEAVASLAEARWPDGPVVLFASELYDAVPVHRVTVRDGALAEFFVEADKHGILHWSLGEPSAPEIMTYLGECGLSLAEGQVAEIRPTARELHAEHLRWCGHGGVALVLDYGHPGRRLYDPRARRGGSLVGYRGHALVEDVLADPGETDITAHVNFDDLERGAADAGWERGVLRPLGSFLTIHGALSLLPSRIASGEPLSPAEWGALGEVKRLLLPTGMGTDLKVLAQGRGQAWQVYQRLATPPPADA